MNDEPLRDPELASALRAFDAAVAWTEDDLERLAHRIDAGAAAILAQRPDAIAWWEFAVVWSRPLLSLGATAAVAAALVIARASTSTPAAAGSTESQSLLNSLVAPIEQQVMDSIPR